MSGAAASDAPPEVQALRAEIVRLNKIIAALMDRGERDMSAKGSDFGLFQTTIVLENQVRERTQELEAALRDNENINRDLYATQERLAAQNAKLQEARDAANAASRAKSQFLANMSHELRTPLNSLLILSQLLADNAGGNLSPRQLQFARTIHRSGTDLLEMINDLLDLAKIEAGRVTVETEEVRFAALQENVARALRHLAEEKGLAFDVELAAALPPACYTDSVRLQQVLRNLISNAIKFTPAGRVALHVESATSGWRADHPVLSRAETVIAFAVSDTGIGIAPDKQQLIFEAFQQAESGTARRYGGTGLGLSISREIANLLGGELTLTSTPGAGSTFTLFLPLAYAGTADGSVPLPQAAIRPLPVANPRLRAALPEDAIADDRASVAADDAVVLIVEDDPAFAHVLVDLAREKGMKVLVAHSGSQGLALAQQHKPAAITLDLILPDIDGWTVYERLRLDPTTAHIPVVVITVRDEGRHALELGALAVLAKPVSRRALEAAFETMKGFIRAPLRSLLVVGNDTSERATIVQMLQGSDIEIAEATTGAAALELLETHHYDCMVLDPLLPDMSGLDLLQSRQADEGAHNLPVVIHSRADFPAVEQDCLRHAPSNVIVKVAHSHEQLVAETCRFLHRSLARLPEAQRQVLERQQEADRPLAGRKVLLVDDDIRNVFALAAALEQHHLVVVSASSGREALAQLPRHPDIAAVLMDIMMPEMDGYETTRRIRSTNGYQGLPVVALTAKAMKGDRERCLAAGCSDFLTKPVDTTQLLATLRDWMHR